MGSEGRSSSYSMFLKRMDLVSNFRFALLSSWCYILLACSITQMSIHRSTSSSRFRRCRPLHSALRLVPAAIIGVPWVTPLLLTSWEHRPVVAHLVALALVALVEQTGEGHPPRSRDLLFRSRYDALESPAGRRQPQQQDLLIGGQTQFILLVC